MSSETKHKMQLSHFIKPSIIILKACAVFFYFFVLFLVTSYFIESFTALNPLFKATNAYLLEPLFLTLIFLALLVIVARIWMAVLLTSLLYVAFMLINAEMVETLGLILSPIDFKHSFQLILAKEFLLGYWKSILVSLVVIIAITFLIIKTKPNQFLKKIQIPSLLFLTLIFGLVSVNHHSVSHIFKKNFVLRGQSVPQIFSEYHGFLFSFFYQALKNKPVEVPDNYSEQTIQDIIKKYEYLPDTVNSTIKPNVIIFFIEAFADPKQTDIQTSYDPIPNFRKYAKQSLSGLVLSPELGGRSANPEFELLTGLSMQFVPEKSIPYIDFINKPYPSIAREFKNNGYQTSALHVANLAFFNYKKAYKFLGFNKVKSLYKTDDVQMDPANRFPSESSLVHEIINQTIDQEKPQFIFSFPNSTHGLWNYDSYLDSDLNVYGEFIDGGEKPLKTYINAIHNADKAIGQLISYFDNQSYPTVIMVLGDHQPSLPEFREHITTKYFLKKHPDLKFNSRKELKRAVRRKIAEQHTNPDIYKTIHQVPYLIWNNFKNQHLTKNTSMNLLSSQLLLTTQIDPNPLYSLISKIYNEISELHKNSKIDERYNYLVDDYALLQYDIMFGERYYFKIIKNK